MNIFSPEWKAKMSASLLLKPTSKCNYIRRVISVSRINQREHEIVYLDYINKGDGNVFVPTGFKEK